MDLALRLAQVQARIAAAERLYHRPPGSVTLLAVSKTRTAAELQAAIDLGLRRFGENYLQEALAKIEALAGHDLEWHYIGPIQSNKTRPIAEHFHWVHSLDRLKVAERLSAQRPDSLPPLKVCIQVNIDDETSKSGCSLTELNALAHAVAALPRLQLRGLMAIPRAVAGLEAQRRPLQRLREAYAELQAQGLALDTLSMGMSADLEAAIAEGATLVRIGTDLFGPRH